ncbi:MAG: response regulator transcription factor [Deltaproteobacteria bacterium]|nr:response regulator transcription factor [Deltaproteobacteria bacterium]
MKILIAEDSVTTRKILEDLLGQWGYTFISATDGNEALRILESDEAPNLAILDWIMPGIEGIEVCRQIRKKKKSSALYSILLTAKVKNEEIIEGLEAGADDYIVKPFEKGELRARIRAGQRVIELQLELAARIKELQAAQSHIKTLQGIIPICAHCHKIRDDQEIWQKIEAYIEKHSGARFSHGICPECVKKYYPELRTS